MGSLIDIPIARGRVTLSASEAEEFIEREALALHERRERRKVKGVGNRRARCQSCSRFLKSDSRPCGSCGYLKDIGWAA